MFSDYESKKREYKDTDEQCRYQGLEFVPFVIDAHAGGISPLARRTLAGFATSIAAACHSEPATVALKMAQRISCSLQRESARAILRRRFFDAGHPAPASGWDAVPAAPQWQ